MTILTKNIKFDDINIGDEIPSFEIEETQETMDKPQKNQWNLIDIGQREEEFPRGEQKNIHNDEEFAKAGLFGATVNAGVTTMGYINQMIELIFPSECFYNGGSMTYKGIGPFRVNDVVNFTGSVVEKRNENGKNFVDIKMKGLDQTNRLVGVAEVTIVIK